VRAQAMNPLAARFFLLFLHFRVPALSLQCESFLQESHLVRDRPLKPLSLITVEMADRVALDRGALAGPARRGFGGCGERERILFADRSSPARA
jgi:hypothetical protein